MQPGSGNKMKCPQCNKIKSCRFKTGICSSCYSLNRYYAKRQIKDCISCGQKMKHNKGKYCDECKIENNRRLSQESSARRRARGARRIAFSEIKVSTCIICKLEIDYTLRYPHPMAPSIEHITPLSHGGKHTKENLTVTHYWCNTRRGKYPQLTMGEHFTFSPGIPKNLERAGMLPIAIGNETNPLRLAIIEEKMFNKLIEGWLKTFE